MALKSLPIALALLSVACVSPNTKSAPTTSQRPTLSSNTNTTAVGTLELEAGTAIDIGDSFMAPMTLKYGIDEDEELFLSVSPINFLDRPGSDGRGFGDLTLGMRRRVWDEKELAVAFQFATKLPTGDEDDGISTGEMDFFGAGIVDYDLDLATTITGFYQFGVIGDPTDTDSNIQHLVAVAGTHTLNDQFGLFGELSTLSNSSAPDPAYAIFGVTHPLSAGFVVDAGIQVGLNTEAPDARFLIGVTTNFGTIFRQ